MRAVAGQVCLCVCVCVWGGGGGRECLRAHVHTCKRACAHMGVGVMTLNY